MKRYHITTIVAIALITLTVGCHGLWSSDATSNTISISGSITDQSSGDALDSVLVQITSPAEFQQSTITDQSGTYRFEIESADPVSLTLRASRNQYKEVGKTIEVSSGTDQTGINIALTKTEDSTGDGGNGGNDGSGSEETVGAAAIVLTNPPEHAININETGENISAAMTFQVQDSLGRALTSDNQVNVQFQLVNSPGGGEDLVPHEATTDADGNVTTTLVSGNAAGPVKVQALITRDDIGLTIKSKPVVIAIHGGFPDQAHFSLAPEKHNYEAYDINNMKDAVTVVLGDKFSNPVKPGTVVYFETSGGIIEGSASTDEDGIATVNLISGNPRSSDGHVTVTASTVNENDERIYASTEVIFATSTAEIDASPNTFDVANGGGQQFSYTIMDRNGNPMPAGSSIKIEAGDGIDLSGDIDFTLGDYLQTGPGRTQFNFSASDSDSENTEDTQVTITITITTPNGNSTSFSNIQGTVH